MKLLVPKPSGQININNKPTKCDFLETTLYEDAGREVKRTTFHEIKSVRKFANYTKTMHYLRKTFALI